MIKKILSNIKSKFEDVALEEARIKMIDKMGEDDFVKFLFNKEKERIIIQKELFDYKFMAYHMNIKRTLANEFNIETGYIDYTILLESKDFDALFFNSYYNKNIKLYNGNPYQLINNYELFKTSKKNSYYKRFGTTIDEIVKYNHDFEFYRTYINSRLREKDEIDIIIVNKY